MIEYHLQLQVDLARSASDCGLRYLEAANMIDIGDATHGIEELVEVLELAFDMKFKGASLEIGQILCLGWPKD